MYVAHRRRRRRVVVVLVVIVGGLNSSGEGLLFRPAIRSALQLLVAAAAVPSPTTQWGNC